MTAGDPRIPILLLTGFLGSGKTTLLNRLLQHPAARSTAVIINEFGEISLDDALIERWDGNSVVLHSGCVCCTVRESLATTLEELFDSRREGTIPRYEAIVLETTGVADPGPILRLLASDPNIAGRHVVRLVATTVDAVNGLRTLDRQPEAIGQIAVADLLILTKVDLADPAEARMLRRRLAIANPLADVIEAGGDASIAALLSDRYQGSDALLRLPPDDAGATHVAQHDNDQDHAVDGHLAGIEQFSFRSDKAIDWAAFSALVTRLNELTGDDLLRVKGLIQIAGQPGPVVLHGVQQMIHSPAMLPAWPAAAGERSTRIVCIVRLGAIAPLRQIFADIFGRSGSGGL